MNERNQQNIREYLRQDEVKNRILKSIQEAKSKMTVTISRAAHLFGFSESQLREWEKRGLLKTERPQLLQEGKSSTGHRQYSQVELEKLAVIRELINRGYAPGDIPPDVDKLWVELSSESIALTSAPTEESSQVATEASKAEVRPIDRRIETTDRKEAWRYFISQSLRIALMLICKDVPDTTVAGLILPLQNSKFAHELKATTDLHKVGASLVGWQGKDSSFYAFLDEAPTFEFPSDFRLETFLTNGEQRAGEDRVLDNAFIVVERRARQFSLAPELVGIVWRLFHLIYAHIDNWQSSFDYGRRDWLYQVHDLTSSAENRIFNDLLERVIELGGKTESGKNRWNFCVLLSPEIEDSSLPVQQQSLIVRAQTSKSSYEIGKTTIDPNDPEEAYNLCLKAFQSGQIVYVASTLHGESMTHSLHPPVITRGRVGPNVSSVLSTTPLSEMFTRGAIAIPVSGEHNISTAVLYIASDEMQAFSQSDQRVLRVIGQMIGELLLTSRARRGLMGRWGTLLDNPAVVDTTFGDFGLETEFVTEVEALLSEVKEQGLTEARKKEEISLIAVDIDNQSSIAITYGNRVARNLSQEVGSRIGETVRVLSGFPVGKVYHVSADRYYLMLAGVSLDAARGHALQLKKRLEGEYRINPAYAIPGRPVLPGNMLVLPKVSVHLAVSSYPLEKLQELLERYPDNSVVNVRALIVEGIETNLKMGRNEGGDCVISWDRETWDFKTLR